MNAKMNDTCTVCRESIEIGDKIGWVRRGKNAGKKYHSACHTKAAVSVPKTKLVDIEAPEISLPIPETVNNFQTQSLPKLTRTSKWWDVLAHSLRHLNRVILIGPPGTGKSTTAMQTARINFRVTMTESTTREDLIGMFHLIQGETKWIDGPVVQAMRLGQPVLIDEIDRYSQEVASMLYSILDDKPHVDLPTGEIVHAKPGYKVVMTSNEPPEMLPAAIFDRIEGIFIASVPHEDAINHLTAVDQQVVRNYYLGQSKPVVKTVPTVRRMRAFHVLKSNGMEDWAAEIVFSGSAKEIESAIANTHSTVNND
jgi:MoxR-like ATPase